MLRRGALVDLKMIEYGCCFTKDFSLLNSILCRILLTFRVYAVELFTEYFRITKLNGIGPLIP